MRLYLLKSPKRVAAAAYAHIKEILTSVSHPILGLATGSTPLRLYKNMVDDYLAGGISFRDTTTINLDEYVGLSGTDVQSYRYFMNKNLFMHIDIDIKNTHIPNGLARDLAKECLRYTELVDKNRPDVQILGIGSNGHIAFNEPGTPIESTTHVVNLDQSTIDDNSRFFDTIDLVPRQAITMGISDILKAKQIILLATGTSKAMALTRMLTKHFSADCPASFLQKHPHVTIYADESATHLLDKSGV